MDRRLLRVALLCFIMAALCAGASAADKSGDGFTRLELNGATAYASYRCGASAQIFVAVYEEDSGKMCALGVKEASAGAGDATIPLDGDIPEHFTAKAFLLDSALAPLCAACPIPFEAEPENDTAVLRGSTNFYANACLDNGVLYYTFLPEPKIYAYNGSDTVSFAAGGTPMNLIARDGVLYYLNDDNGAIYALDLDAGTRKILYNREEVYDFVIRGNELFMRTPGALSVMDLTTKQVRKIYESENIQRVAFEPQFQYPSVSSAYENNITFGYHSINANSEEFIYGANQILLVKSKNEPEPYEISKYSYIFMCTLVIEELNPANMETREIGRIASEGVMNHFTPYFGAYNQGYQYVETGNDIYFRLRRITRDESLSVVGDEWAYYKLNLPSETIAPCTEAEYIAASGKWLFFNSNHGNEMAGINPLTGIQEVLMRSSKRLFTVSQPGDKVIAFECGVPLKVKHSLKTDYTEWLSSAALYMMDLDGNNPVELANYSSATGTASGDGNAFIESSGIERRTCHICNGAGNLNCLYCHGSGACLQKSVGGISYATCPFCRGTGKSVCKICWGTGQVVS